MLRSRLWGLGLGLLSAVAFCGDAFAKDWPQWGGTDGRNMVSDETGLPSSFEPGRREPKGKSIDLATAKNVKWVTRLGSMNCSTPAVVDGRVFVGAGDEGQGLFLCLDGQTGKLLWQWTRRRVTFPPKSTAASSGSATFPGRSAYVRRRPSMEIASTLSRIDSKSFAWTSRGSRPKTADRSQARRRSCGCPTCGIWACGRRTPATARC